MLLEGDKADQKETELSWIWTIRVEVGDVDRFLETGNDREEIHLFRVSN